MNSETADDRRSSPRKMRSECQWLVAVRVRPGREVRLLDLSRGGALVEGTMRLLPGAIVELHLVGLDRRHSVRGRVIRSAVSSLDGGTGVLYRAALAFEDLFTEPQHGPAASQSRGFPTPLCESA